MATPATKPLPCSLPDALRPRAITHNLAESPLRGGDQLHLTAAVLGLPKGITLPIAGFCATVALDGTTVNVVAYVLPMSATAHSVGFSERDYRRFPCALYREKWFGTPPVCFVEIDLTDYADCVKLERLPERLQAEMEVSYALAA